MKTKNDAEVKFKVILDGNEAEKHVDNLSKKAKNLGDIFTNAGKKLTIGLTIPITGLAVAGIKYNATMEKYNANLTTLLGGNKEAADELLADLKAMANTTPFETTSLVKATQTMLGFGIEVESSQKYLKQLGDISMGDAQKLESLTLAFSQVSSAGKLSGQDLLQMINAGFNPLNIISQKTGESMADLKERMSEGALSSEEVAKALQWATEEGGLYYGAMEKASQTTEGKFSTLKDEFNSAVGELTSGLLPTFTKLVDKLTGLAKWFSKLSPKQKDFVVKMGLILASIGPVVAIIGKLIKVGAGIKNIIALIKSWNLVTKAMSVAQGALNIVMNANPISLIIIGITSLIAMIVLLYNKCEWFRNFINGMISGIVSLVSNVASTIQTIFSPLFEWFSELFGSFFNTIKTTLTTIVGLFRGTWETIKIIWGVVGSWFKGIFSTAWTAIKTVFSPVGSFFSGIWNEIKKAFGSVSSWFRNTFSSAWNAVKNVFSTGGKIFDGIKDGIASTFKTVVNGIIKGINKVIAVPFNTINGVLKKIKNVNIAGVKPFKGLINTISVPKIPTLNVGTNYVAQEGLAYLHQGEAVVPKKYNPALGGNNQVIYVTVNADMDVNKFGKAFVRDIKTFSGGAKNSYNYGGSR